MDAQNTLKGRERDIPDRSSASNAAGGGSIPGQGTKTPHAMRHGQKKSKKI